VLIEAEAVVEPEIEGEVNGANEMSGEGSSSP
jgi:hypothetical protein